MENVNIVYKQAEKLRIKEEKKAAKVAAELERKISV